MESHDVLPATGVRSLTTAAAKASPANAGGVRILAPDTSSPVQRGSWDRLLFSSDASEIKKLVVATHAPELEGLDVKPILPVIEAIILPLEKPSTTDGVALGAQPQSHADNLDGKVTHSSEQDAEIFQVLAYPINQFSREMMCKCAAGVESHSATLELLKSLSIYSWDAKVVITLAAFAINYGQFWLVEHFQTENARVKNIATLKDLVNSMPLPGEFETLLTTVLKVTHSILEFNELPAVCISPEPPEVTAAMARIPTAVYWVIRSLLVCAFTLLNRAGSSQTYITGAISNLAKTLSKITHDLQIQLENCKTLNERKKEEDAHTKFQRTIESEHDDNMKVLGAIIRSGEDQRLLYNGSKRTTERLEVMRGKYVLLLISDLDFPLEELNILHLIYDQYSMRPKYEILWLPMVDPTTLTSREPVFYDLRNNHMPWYSVDHPSLVERVAIRYIQEVWKFVHTPMLVVLDPRGKPSNLDAFPMMWIWGGNAFPFTQAREESLWSETTWNIDLLIDAIDPRIPDWIRGQKVICLYGGEDIEWVRRFTLAAGAVARDLQVPLEMLYVGKRKQREKARMCHDVIDREKLSHMFPLASYYDYVWYFWVRLVSMWNSMKHIGMTVENDRIMQEITEVLAFDSNEHGWAVFSRANDEITKEKGDILMPVLENYQQWAHLVDHPDKFVNVLDQQLRGVSREHHCNRLILPGQHGYVPERVVCPDCGRNMDAYVMYSCCTD